MLPNNDEVKKTNTNVGAAVELSLEARLIERPNLDMDIMQFLTIAGFGTRWKPLHEEENEHILDQVWDKYLSRRRMISKRAKGWETGISRLLSFEYRKENLKTLRDLKNYVEDRKGKTGVRFIGVLRMAYLNSAFKHFDIEEIDYRRPQGRLKNFVHYKPFL